MLLLKELILVPSLILPHILKCSSIQDMNLFLNLNEHLILAGWWGWSREVLQGFRETPQETCMCRTVSSKDVYWRSVTNIWDIFFSCVLVSGVWRIGSRSCKAILIKLLNLYLLNNVLPKVCLCGDTSTLVFLFIVIMIEQNSLLVFV